MLNFHRYGPHFNKWHYLKIFIFQAYIRIIYICKKKIMAAYPHGKAVLERQKDDRVSPLTKYRNYVYTRDSRERIYF